MPLIEVDGCALNVAVDGEERRPALMLSNSLGCTLEMWQPQMEALGRRFRVIRYDRRGHGSSAAPDGPYSVERLARDALGILDHLGIRRTHWCGISLGGVVGQWLAVDAPDRLDRLILANTTCHFPDPTNWLNRMRAVEAAGLESIADTVLTGWLTAGFRQQQPEATSNLRRMLVSTAPAAYVACCSTLSTLDQRDLLSQIRSPTLVIAGKHDKSTPLEAALFIKERVRDAVLEVVDAAHISNVEQATKFTSAVVGFLSEQPPGPTAAASMSAARSA